MLVSVSTVYAQSAAASASVTIMSPVVFSKTEDISFNTLTLNTASSQEVVLISGGLGFHSLYIPKISIFKPTQKGVFTIYGCTDNFYSISTQLVIKLLHSNGEEHIYAQSMIDESSLINSVGERSIIVDAKVYVDHTQLAGSYTSKNFTLTINFN